MRFEVATYRDQDTGRARLAVYSPDSRTWLFPGAMGQKPPAPFAIG